MRVTVVASDGASVEVHVQGGYNPDVLDDMTARAATLLATVAAVASVAKHLP